MSNEKDFIIENGVLTKYVGPGGDVVIPAGVTQIGPSAFSGCTKITSVTLCDGVAHIGACAFEKCRKMEKINLPYTICKIEKGAFYYCDELKSLELPEDVQIGQVRDIVANCFHLVSLILPRSLVFEKTFDDDQFFLFGCNQIAVLVYPGVKLDDISPKLQAAAINGFTSYYERFTDQNVRESYLDKLIKKKNVLLKMIFRYDDASLLQLLADRGKLSAKSIEEEYLNPAVEAKAVQCTQFILNWKNTHTKAERDLSASLDKPVSAAAKDPFNAADMKKIWASEKAEDGTLVLTGYKAKEQQIEIPSRIGKNSISKLGDYLFSIYMSGGSIYAPKNKPFDKALPMRKIQIIRVPEGVKEIGLYTFHGCIDLEHLYLPATVSSIGQFAFLSGYGSIHDCAKVTIHAPAGSYAETYAKEKNIPFVAE